MAVPAPDPCPKLTRRQALALGAAAGVTASATAPGGLLATVAATAATTGMGGPRYLQRSAYAGREGQEFAVGGIVFELEAVGDVAGARSTPRLAGHEDAFELIFRGRADALADGVHELYHPTLGPFPLFLGAVDAPDGLSRAYGATIDRTVRIKELPKYDTAGSQAGAAPPAVAPAAVREADVPDPLPSPRDEAIVLERAAVATAPASRRRRASRRSRAAIRRAHANRVRFKRKKRLERKRLARARGGWLTRHGR